MKNLKCLIAICTLFFANVYGMEDPGRPINAQVDVYFAPEDQKAINNKLFSLLNTAKKQVLIAMYQITNYFIIDKLIELKKRGIRCPNHF